MHDRNLPGSIEINPQVGIARRIIDQVQMAVQVGVGHIVSAWEITPILSPRLSLCGFMIVTFSIRPVPYLVCKLPRKYGFFALMSNRLFIGIINDFGF